MSDQPAPPFSPDEFLRRAVAFDVETYLIEDGVLAPALVLGSIAMVVDGKVEGQLLDKEGCVSAFWRLLHSDKIIVTANGPFDLLVMANELAKRGVDVMPLIFQKYDRDEVVDILVSEGLHAIAGGHLGRMPSGGGFPKGSNRYSLDVCVRLNLGRDNAKANDEWRLRYGELDGVPLDELPATARQYPVDDTVNTLEVGLTQYGAMEHPPCPNFPRGGTHVHANLHDSPNQVRAHWAMHLGAAWGFNIDGEYLDKLEAEVVHEYEDALGEFIDLGFIRGEEAGSKAGSKDTAVIKRAVAEAYGAVEECPHCTAGQVLEPGPDRNCGDCSGTGLELAPGVPTTPSGKVKTSMQALVDSGDGRLLEFAYCLTERPPIKEVRRLVAAAYGSSDKCPTCSGSGRVPGPPRAASCKAYRIDVTAEVFTDRRRATARLEELKRTGVAADYHKLVKVPTCDSTGYQLEGTVVPRTAKGAVQCGRDVLYESGDDVLVAYAGMLEKAKLRETYIPYLRRGVGKTLTLAANPLVDTGRTSYGGVIQQLPREGGIRDAIVARLGYLLCSCDYPQLELYTHAQSCLWLMPHVTSELAIALNNNLKIHCKLAGEMIGEPYERCVERHKSKDPAFKPLRQAAKPGNYGFGGGMGAVKLVLQQRKQGPDTPHPSGPVEILVDGEKVRGYKGLRFCVLVRGTEKCGATKVTEWGPPGRERPCPPTCRDCIEVAEELRKAWFKAWPENREYFKLISEIVEKLGWVEQHVSRRRRGGVRFTSAANGFFQGLAADGAKRALYLVSRECYAVPSSPLYGSRVILFAHDEIVAEVLESMADPAARRIAEIMTLTMRAYLPDVGDNMVVEPALMRRLYKAAELREDEDGKLIPWEPAAKMAA